MPVRVDHGSLFDQVHVVRVSQTQYFTAAVQPHVSRHVLSSVQPLHDYIDRGRSGRSGNECLLFMIYVYGCILALRF